MTRCVGTTVSAGARRMSDETLHILVIFFGLVLLVMIIVARTMGN
jgi:hypothetical protein